MNLYEDVNKNLGIMSIPLLRRDGIKARNTILTIPEEDKEQHTETFRLLTEGEWRAIS